MVITCERCSASFRIDPSKLGSTGANVRCGKCGYVFFAGKASPPETTAQPTAPRSEYLFEMMNQVQAAVESKPTTPEDSPPAAKASEPAETPVERAAPRPVRTVTPFPRPEESLARRPMVQQTVSMRQRLFRGLIVLAIALSGLLLGGLAIGIRPTPGDLAILLRHGKFDLTDQLIVAHSHAQLLSPTATQKILAVDGELYNRSRRTIDKIQLRLVVFSEGTDFLGQATMACCDDKIPPKGRQPFSMRLELSPTASPGNFKVTVDQVFESGSGS